MIRYIALCVVLLVASLVAQEKYTLTAPVAQTSLSDFTMQSLHLDWGGKTIEVYWTDNRGGVGNYRWTEATATKASTLMISLNKANLSTAGNSLQARVFKQLQTDGIVAAGTVTGLPQ